MYAFDLFDYIVLGYFASHIPITACIDAQAVLSIHPQAIKDLLAWYVSWSGDPLMGAPTPLRWFQGIVWVEITLQMSFFFFALYAWLNRKECIRLPAIMYGSHTATTLIPIFSTFLAPEAALTEQQRYMLLAIYSPYFLVPCAIVWRCMAREKLFPEPAASLKQGKQH
jgi:hypothetical protein